MLRASSIPPAWVLITQKDNFDNANCQLGLGLNNHRPIGRWLSHAFQMKESAKLGVNVAVANFHISGELVDAIMIRNKFKLLAAIVRIYKSAPLHIIHAQILELPAEHIARQAALLRNVKDK